MKRILLVFASITSLANLRVEAQITTLCGIWFDYDAAGNRIKRYPGCRDWDPNAPVFDPGPIRGMKTAPPKELVNRLDPAVTPNPTSGAYTIVLPSDSGAVHFHWYDSKGSLVKAGQFTGTSHSGSIGEFVPGSYLLLFQWGRTKYTFKITKQD